MVEVEDAAPEPDPLIGQTLASRYQIESRLGEGAMGAVYKARHVKVGRAFAVKVLHAHLLEDKKVLQRFEREAELAGRLRHPNVIGVVDVGDLPDGTRYMVMDFAAGPDLATLLSEAPFPPTRIIRLARQMLEGLYHAHEAGLIHRDFKPENVIVEHDTHGAEVPRIVDFGIAILREGGASPEGPGRLTTNGLVLGTPHYMAPEQAVADPIDHRIDLFALGIMIYEMLCGKLPFDGSGAEVARANLMLDPPPIAERVPYLDVDPLLEAFARRMMAKKRDHRPATAKAARELLDLIERDRAAAAAALGLPVDAARPAKDTQPVSPTRVRDGGSETFPPPIRDGLETPPQAPRMAAPVAVAADAVPPSVHARSVPVRERDIVTDPVRASQRRARWPLVALALAALGGAGVVAYALHGGAPKPAAGSVQVASAEPVQVAPTQPAAAPAPAQPQPAPAQPAPAQPAPAQPVPAPAPAPAPAAPHAHPASHVRATAHPHHTPEHVAEVTPVHHDEPPAPPQPPQPLDAAGFATLYQRVGAELDAYERSHGQAAASGLWERYRLINYGAVIGNQAKRDQAVAILRKLQAEAHR